MSPAGNVTGKALVVYDPGITGAAKGAASDIAGDLKGRGYTVDLAGVKSKAASDAAGYDVIVVGGPTYAGNISSSIKAYLDGLRPSSDAKVGVFATGSAEPENSDPAYMLKFVAGLPADGPLKVKASAKILSSGDVEEQCSDFVSALLR
jgi:menaquinone-dependent protoporphyrinogen IX oxidase